MKTMPNTKANAYTKVEDLTPDQLAARRRNDLRRQHRHRAKALGLTLEDYRDCLWRRQRLRLFCEACDGIAAEMAALDGPEPKNGEPKWIRFYDRPQRQQWIRFCDR